MLRMHTAIVTKTCMLCGQQNGISVPEEVIEQMAQGVPVQVAWPYSTPSEREVLITGSHPECWDSAFGELDCD